MSPAPEGTRKLYVPASSRPARQPAVEPSQAAVLFDIVYAASISHHAMTVSNAPPAATAATMLIYLSTATPLIWQWWVSSAYLARFDSGDLLNEFVLVLGMILVLGQSITIEPCAACALVQAGDTAYLEKMPDAVNSLECAPALQPHDLTPPLHNFGAVPGQLSAHCWLYMCFTFAMRLLQILNSLRAYFEVRESFRDDASLMLLEQLVLLPLWLVPLYLPVAGAYSVWVIAAALELLIGAFEPIHTAAAYVAHRVGRMPPKRTPLDVGYTEKRWHRLLMIALALLPSFHGWSYRRLYLLTFFGLLIGTPCILAYAIKLFYFDLVDDGEKAVKRRTRPSGRTVRHALEHQVGGARWRAQLWIFTQVFLVLAVALVGTGLGSLLSQAHDGSSEGTQASSQILTRALITTPIAVILYALCLQHGVHVGGGHGTRRIGKRKRLACRVFCATAIGCLPLVSLTDIAPADSIPGPPSPPSYPPFPPTSPPPMAPPVVPAAYPLHAWDMVRQPVRVVPAAAEPARRATAEAIAQAPAQPPPLAPPPPPPPAWRTVGDSFSVFVALLAGLLGLQLAFELYGRGFLHPGSVSDQLMEAPCAD